MPFADVNGVRLQSEMHPIPDADHDILAYEAAAIALRDWVGRVLLKAIA